MCWQRLTIISPHFSALGSEDEDDLLFGGECVEATPPPPPLSSPPSLKDKVSHF